MGTKRKGSSSMGVGDSSRDMKKRPRAVAASSTFADNSISSKILSAEKRMANDLDRLSFRSPVTHVYNPLQYAWDAHQWYVEKFGDSEKKVLLVGMNPGPWGMAQTGVPFGEVRSVAEWLGMPSDTNIRKPTREHPKREVCGLNTKRSEVSGKRLWHEWAEQEYSTPDTFFATFYVHNYCPLMFMEQTGRNRTPAQLKADERQNIAHICDLALADVVEAMKPKLVCGIGQYAKERCEAALGGFKDLSIGYLLHPSPASPASNKGWKEKFMAQLETLMKNL